MKLKKPSIAEVIVQIDWIRSQGFGGVMVWALDLDDFTGTCGTGKWPLLTTINDKLGGLAVQPINNYIPSSGYRNTKTSLFLIHLISLAKIHVSLICVFG